MTTAILITFILCVILRLVSRGCLFKRKLNQSFVQGVLPVQGFINLGQTTLSRNLCLSSILCMSVSAALFGGVIIWQYYQNILTLTHAYGIILGNYTAPDYSIYWTVLMTLGAVAFVAGLVYRFLILKKILVCFSSNSVFLLILGIIEPTLFYLALTMSTHNYLLNKREKDMTREEFMMYCAMRGSQ